MLEIQKSCNKLTEDEASLLKSCKQNRIYHMARLETSPATTVVGGRFWERSFRSFTAFIERQF